MPIDPKRLEWMQVEVKGGLANTAHDRYEAEVNQACYDYDAERFAPYREAEVPPDERFRPKNTCGLTRQVVDVLAEGAYEPAPNRKVEDVDERVAALIERFYETVQINALMAECEAMAHLNNIVAIEIEPIEGGGDAHPADVKVWTRDEFTAFVDPDNPKRAEAVCTIDRFDMQTRYRLWTDEAVYTYMTSKASDGSGREITLVMTEANIYGVLPFVFVPYSPQVRRFTTPAVGDLLAKTELRVNDRLSTLDEDLSFAAQMLVMRNFPPDYNPMLKRGTAVRINDRTIGGEVAVALSPQIETVDLRADVEGVWNFVTRLIDQVVQACRAPLSVVRLDQQAYASGVAIVAEQAPLAQRARARRPRLRLIELQLVRLLLRVLGVQRDDAQLLAASEVVRLAVEWPEQRLVIPGPERDLADDWEISHGAKSIIDVVVERNGSTREQAIEHLRRVEEDKKELATINPAAAAAALPQPTEPPAAKSETA